jgi:isocitrate dehydrogenase
MTDKVAITVAHGDGIGPEIMSATLRVLEESGAALEYENIEIGKAVYERGFSSGIEPEAWESLRRTKVFLKAPITTPQGGGFKSLNVTIRKSLGMFANVRPCVSYHPFVKTKHPGMDVVIVRENEEDLYAGIEHRQTDDVYQTLKLISRPGSEKIIRYAFEYARRNGRKKVTCFSKDNIMKLTDGLFHSVFDEIGAEYPEIENEHWIIDIGAAKLADTPEAFDVIVMPNLYGDILSDVAAQITGSVGLGGSANIGEHCAMFEAIHGSAPDIAGKGIANPSGLLLGSVLMLNHIGQPEQAETIHNAWLKTIEDGIHTGDVYTEGTSRERVGTDGFTDALVKRLGQKPDTMAPVEYDKTSNSCFVLPKLVSLDPSDKKTVGVDVFVHFRGSADELAGKILGALSSEFSMKIITNRGVKVWPGGMPETFCSDHWRCRFHHQHAEVMSHREIIEILNSLGGVGLDFIKTENLCTFDGERGYSLAQGE